MARCTLALLIAVFTSMTNAQSEAPPGTPSTFPHIYPNQPTGDYNPSWQTYFEVTDPLPNVTFTLPRSFAGNIPVNRAGHPNDTLFFWGFENSNGSLTAAAGENVDAPWGIWLQGGPGSSSMAGLTLENGPLHVNNDYSITVNNYSWHQIVDYIYIDQPVGTGFSTSDSKGYIFDEDQMASDFFGFLSNLVKVFPSLATRPLHLTGESYAGMYIPYITKAYFGMSNPPVKLVKISIGDGVLGDGITFGQLPTLNVIETYPQLIGYSPEVYEYFKEQTHLCKYDLNLTYPQTGGNFPTLQYVTPAGRPNLASGFSSTKMRKGKNLQSDLKRRVESRGLSHEKREVKRDFPLSNRANGSIDPWYGCYLYDELLDYAINNSFPWTLGSVVTEAGFDVYDIPDALDPEAPQDPSVFLRDNRTISAIHAPTDIKWYESIEYPFGNDENGFDPSPAPMTFLDELAANATAQNVSIIIYYGNDDSLVPHRGGEVVIQNTTFGGIQGFTQPPSTPWTDDTGKLAGIIHQERNWTFALVRGAGHLVPFYQPAAAFALAREFIFGTNQTGLLTSSNSTVGGTSSALSDDILPEYTAPIFYGSGTTVSTYMAPTATVQAWDSFIMSITSTTGGGNATASTTPGSSKSAGISTKRHLTICSLIMVLASVLVML